MLEAFFCASIVIPIAIGGKSLNCTFFLSFLTRDQRINFALWKWGKRYRRYRCTTRLLKWSGSVKTGVFFHFLFISTTAIRGVVVTWQGFRGLD